MLRPRHLSRSHRGRRRPERRHRECRHRERRHRGHRHRHSAARVDAQLARNAVQGDAKLALNGVRRVAKVVPNGVRSGAMAPPEQAQPEQALPEQPQPGQAIQARRQQNSKRFAGAPPASAMRPRLHCFSKPPGTRVREPTALWRAPSWPCSWVNRVECGPADRRVGR